MTILLKSFVLLCSFDDHQLVNEPIFLAGEHDVVEG